MMTALATVSAVTQKSSGYDVELSCEQQTSCSSCSSQKSCGTGIVSKAVGKKILHWQLFTQQALSVGQVVEIGMAEKSLLQSAAIVYLTPLFALIAGAALAHLWIAPWLGLGEGVVILLSALFAAGGIALAKRLAGRIERQSSQQVILLRVLGEPIQ
ncbi:SoxR reducing system RseC family protein [Vibrio panuliri]|uniref:Transcriptional regulator n=1 Tax=Vibrio panuliri TaxID=1381081 RepID=A0A1Q9HH06_9VIBR|nr:SoxR reducing system RseC family protein [Vibrio panuliri]KAB1460072.1 transcriptional regulator [Vibrio panuliri]OLQ89264.1 transcriptional regulator [Vibrio panuliri]OLQ96474.1 transcriptional regulator [Vibrio panuliri]